MKADDGETGTDAQMTPNVREAALELLEFVVHYYA